MINPDASTKFIAITSESFDDLTLKMSKVQDVLETRGYEYVSSNIFTETLNGMIGKIHAVLIYKKKEIDTTNE